jgi:hypothetical protein
MARSKQQIKGQRQDVAQRDKAKVKGKKGKKGKKQYREFIDNFF